MFIKNKTRLIVLFFTLLIPTISFAKNNLNLSNDERKILFKAMEDPNSNLFQNIEYVLNKQALTIFKSFQSILKQILILGSSITLGFETFFIIDFIGNKITSQKNKLHVISENEPQPCRIDKNIIPSLVELIVLISIYDITLNIIFKSKNNNDQNIKNNQI
ncbi:hypothetical protein GF322_03385 [Candidatus Dependentiae bacterium]|nr:hypothetical protein [Candidatus Dependentiae bacterium]